MRRRVSAANFNENFGQIETCGFDLAKNMGEECEVAVPLRPRGALFTPDYYTHDPNDRRSGSYDSVCACLYVDLMGFCARSRVEQVALLKYLTLTRFCL